VEIFQNLKVYIEFLSSYDLHRLYLSAVREETKTKCCNVTIGFVDFAIMSVTNEIWCETRRC